MSKLEVIPGRFWLKVYGGKWWFTVGFQHRIAWPPAEKQTCHHQILVRKTGIHFSKEII